MRTWLAASVYCVRGWWWLGTATGLWLSWRDIWQYAHEHHDFERHLPDPPPDPARGERHG